MCIVITREVDNIFHAKARKLALHAYAHFSLYTVFVVS
jgi:hypothetical protein